MVQGFQKLIENIELIKIGRVPGSPRDLTFFYNIKLEGIDDLLIIETPFQIDSNDFIGNTIKYEVDRNTNEVSKFEFL